MQRYYAIVVPAQRELAAKEILEEAGYDVICPVEMKWRRKSRYGKARVERPFPLMPRYLFIGSEHEPDWWHLRALELPAGGKRLVQSVVPSWGPPARLPEHVVDALKGLEFRIPAINPHRSFRVGDRVEIADGPLRGRTARVRRIVARRAQIIVQWFNSMHEINVPLELLEAA